MVAVIAATASGCRYGATSTSVPNRMRDVLPRPHAHAASGSRNGGDRFAAAA